MQTVKLIRWVLLFLSARVEKEIESFHQMFHEASDGKREYEWVKEVFKK